MGRRDRGKVGGGAVKEERVSISKFFFRKGGVECWKNYDFVLFLKERRKEMRLVSTRWQVFCKEYWG